MRRRHRWLRWAGWCCAGLGALLLFVAATVLIVLHTDWGREQLRRQAENQLNQLVEGTVTVGRITGSPITAFMVEGLTVRDRFGRPAVTVGAFALDWSPLSLISKTFHANAVELTGPVVVGARDADGQLNLATLLKKSEPSTTPSTWTVVIDRLVIRDGLVVLPEGMSFGALQLDGGVRITGTSKEVVLARLGASWLERGLPIELRGRVVTSDAFTVVSAFEAHAGASRLAVPFAQLESEQGGLVAIVDGELREAQIASFWPHSQPLGNFTIGGAVTRADGQQPLAAKLHASGLSGELWADMSVDLETRGLRGELRVRGIVPPVQIPAHLDLDARFDLAGRSIETARGTVVLGARGEISGRSIERLQLDANLGGGMARADASLVAMGSEARLHTDIRLGDELALEASRLTGRIADLGIADPGLAGSASVDLTASGNRNELAVRGTVQAEQLGASSVRIGSARVALDVHGLPSAPTGQVQLEANGVAFGKERIGLVRAQAQTVPGGNRADVRITMGGRGVPYGAILAARVAQDAKAVRIGIRDLAVTARGFEVNARQGQVTLRKDGGVEVEHLVLTSEAGKVEITGQLDRPHAANGRGRLSGSGGQLHLHVAGLDLARIQAAFAPQIDPISGLLSLDAHLLRDGTRLGIEGELAAQAVHAGRNLPPLDASTRFNIGDGRLVASGHVRERLRGGVLDFAITSIVPKQILDAAAWRAVDLEAALQGATVELRELDVGMLARLGHQPGYAGRIDGSITARPGARTIDLAVQARGITTPAIRGLDADVTGTWDHAALSSHAELRLAGTPALQGDATLGAGVNALLHGADLGHTPLEARFQAHNFDLDRLRSVLTQGVALSGRADLTLEAKGPLLAPSARAQVALKNASLAGVRFETFDAKATLDALTVTATATAQQKDGGTLELKADVDRQQANASTATLRARGFDLGFLPALARGRTDALAGAGGKLDAEVTTNLSAKGRSARGSIRLTDGSFYLPSSGLIKGIDLAAQLEDDRLVVSKLTGRVGTSGFIDATADIALTGLAPQGLAGRVTITRLPVLASVMVVQVDAVTKLTGRLQDDGWDLQAKVTGTTVHMPRERRGGDKLQAIGPLNDMVFTDEPNLTQRTGLSAISGSPELKEGGGLEARIAIDATSGVHVTGQEVDVLTRPQLVVRLHEGATSIGGSIQTERGFIELFGRRWDIATANLSFDASEDSPNPRLDIELVHEFQTTTVHIGVTGTVREPKLMLRAEPGQYEEGQILAWVLGGSPDDPANEKQALSDKAVGMASNVLLGQLQSQLRTALPIDVLAVHVGEGADTQTTRVEVGKWLTDDLFLGYRVRLNAPETKNLNEANIEWRLGKRWLLDAFFGDRSVGGADLIWSKKY